MVLALAEIIILLATGTSAAAFAGSNTWAAKIAVASRSVVPLIVALVTANTAAAEPTQAPAEHTEA